MQRHVRDERATRERYGLIGDGRELASTLGVGWCGEVCSGSWFFQSLDHVAHSILSSGPEPCPRCIAAAIECLQRAAAPAPAELGARVREALASSRVPRVATLDDRAELEREERELAGDRELGPNGCTCGHNGDCNCPYRP